MFINATVREQLDALELTKQLKVDSKGKTDAQTLPFFERELEQVLTTTYERKFPELAMANGDVIPISSEVDEGAETYTYYMYEPTGIARFMTAYADADMPMVSIRGAKVTAPVEPMEVGYAYTTRDIRNAAFARRPLDQKLAVAARRAHDQRVHITGLWGREDLGLSGFVNNPNITVADAPAGAGGGGNPEYWVNKTPDEIVADIAMVIDGVETLTNKVEMVTDVAISNPLFLYIRRTRLGTIGESKTILTYIREVWPNVNFYGLIDLQASNSLGNLDEDCMIGYARDAEKCSLEIPMPFKQYPVQQDGLKFKVPTESSMGGVKCPYPLSIYRLDGIGSN